MVEATEIANGYSQPTELKILPPPLIGGYSHTYNIFEAAIAFDLPFDFELLPQQVFDLVNQTVWAIERDSGQAGKAGARARHNGKSGDQGGFGD